jgi:mRNA interferase RelE/StbE
MPQKERKPYKLRVSGETAEFIRGLHPEIKRKVKAALDIITSDPSMGKSLRMELRGLRSYKVGRFRIIYRNPSKRIIEIVAVGPRKTIYQETYRLLRKSF